jgi:sugar phosphate isomerase/epimerase
MRAREAPLARLCLHTVTTKPWSIDQAIDGCQALGIGGLSIWRQALEDRDPARVGEQVRAAGLSVVSLCRGGFFADPDPGARRRAVQDNLQAIDLAAALGAPLLVLVCGASPAQPLEASRRQIREGIEAVLPHAQAAGVLLGVEPLHPMYADNRSAINTLRQANDLCEDIDSPGLGVVLDVYHLWWDPDLASEIDRCGRAGRIFAFHVSDWRTPTTDLLNDRRLMGQGCIPLRLIRSRVEAAGFDGFIEVEVFSEQYWKMDQRALLAQIVEAYRKYV